MMCAGISDVPSQMRSTRASRQTGEREIIHQAHTAVNTDRLVRHPRQHFGGVELSAGNLAIIRDAFDRAAAFSEQISSVDFRHHISQLKAHALEFANLLTELLAFSAVVEGIVERPAARARRSWPQRLGACSVEPLVHHPQAASNLAQTLAQGPARNRQRSRCCWDSRDGRRRSSLADSQIPA